MPNRDPTSQKTDILPGTLDLMILQTAAMLGPVHGYQIAERLAQVSVGSLQLNMGTLYPALVRLEQRGFLRASWAKTENNRRARFYRITAAGKRQLEREQSEWNRMVGIMDRLTGEVG